MSRKDLVKEIVATAAPIFIKKALKYLAAGHTPSEDEITAEVIAECEEVGNTANTVQTTQATNTMSVGDESDYVQYAGPYGNLVATLYMIVDDLANDIRMQILQELTMKLHVELSRMREEINNAKLDVTSATKYSSGGAADPALPFGGLPQFDVTEDDTRLDSIKTGYASIASYSPVNLTGNPLFDMVNKSVERSQAGLSAHTAEDFNAARKNRITDDEEGHAVEAAIINAEKKYYDGIETDVRGDITTNDDLWDKMFAEKYGGTVSDE